MADVKPPTRKERAAATRRRMMEAAYRVFSASGWSGTTMDAIAAEAGVAVQTLYFTFHTKAELLQAAFDFAVLGPEDPTPPHLSAWWRAAEAEPDVAEALGHVVAGTMEIFRRAAPLVWVIQGDPDARAAYQFNEDLRIQGYGQMVAMLAAKHPLRPGLTRARARDLMLVLLGPAVFQSLTAERGWSIDEFGAWVTGALLRELFAVDPPKGRRRARGER